MRLVHLKEALNYFLFAIFWLTVTLGVFFILTPTANAQTPAASLVSNALPQSPVHVRVNEPLITGAANHASFVQQISYANTLPLSAPKDLDRTMEGLAQIYSPDLGANFIGYGALVGTLNADFVNGVRKTAYTKGLDVVIYRLYSNPNYASQIAGAKFASADIQNAWQSDINNINGAGVQIKKQSYSIQKQSQWKALAKKGRKKRLHVISSAKTQTYLAPLDTRQKLAALDGDSTLVKHTKFWPLFGIASPKQQQLQPMTNKAMNHKALTLAALDILGASGGQSQDWVKSYMLTPRLNQCVNKARLNMEQCLAAGHFKYEDAFCVAQHELTEVGGCLQQSLL